MSACRVLDAEEALAAGQVQLEIEVMSLARAEEALVTAKALGRQAATLSRATVRVASAAERVQRAQTAMRCLVWQAEGARRSSATA